MDSEKFKSRNSTWCSTSLHVSKEVFVASSVFLWLGLLLGLLCNSAVIMTILHRWSLRSSTVNILVVSLCVADLLGTTCDIPLIITIQISNYLRFQLPRAICSLQVFFHAFASGAQATGLVAVGFERYHSIARPLEANVKRTLWRMKTGIMSTWSVGLLLGIINLTLVPDTITYDYCTQLRGHDSLSHDALLYLFLPFGLICIVLITSCYICIIMSVRQHSRSVGSSLQVPPTIRVTNMQSPDDTSQPHVFTVSDAFLSPATSCLELKTDPETLCTSPCNHLAPGRYRNKITLSSKPNMKNTLTTFDPSNINDSNSVLSVCNSLSLPNRDGLSSHCISSHKDFQFSANETTASESLGYQPHQSGNPIFSGSLQSCQTSDQFVSMKSASTNSCKSLRNSVIKVKNVSLLKAAREQNSPQPLCLNSDAISITTSVSDNISPSSTPKGNKTNLAKKNLFTDQATMSCRNSSLTRHCELENEQHIKLIPPLLIERSHSNENSIYQEICLGAKNNCERGKRKMETQTAKRAGYIIASFVLLWLPQPLTTFLENSVFTDVAHAHNIQMFTVSVATFSAAMNPIVYGLAIKQFRATFITMVLNQWRRWKQRWLW